ncbi:hypothetical protein [Methylobacterium sp. J-070]|uniref:hypothetical protein n=1 Tax=Methylobacterium sp. J-070 TaxID=2836650 RepID=UPI001FB87FE0|nr:hypothetical protein [Methylobacterium sp. J-070]MCJ2048678.1 hypothetical protein [Methylobacterium sp. J-070]
MSDLPLFDPFKALEEIRRKGKSEVSPKLSPEVSPPSARDIIEQNHILSDYFSNSSNSSHPSRARAHVPSARTREEEEERKENIIKSYTYARGEGSEAGPPISAPCPPARVARTARVFASGCAVTEKSEIEVARVSGDGLREWRTGLSRLSAERPACPGYRDDEWVAVLRRALRFLDTFGAQAEALGWTASRLFGVHREAGIVRVDACGGLVLPVNGSVRAITATEISFGHLTHREKPGQPEGVPWWEFGQ